MTLLLLTGCLGITPGIPHSKGTVDEAVLPNLLAVASPDLPYLLMATFGTATVQDFRGCPELSVSSSAYVLTATDCADTNGVRWNGTATVTASSDRFTYSFDEFAISGLSGGWNATGRIDAIPSTLGSGFDIDATLQFHSLDSPELALWVDTRGTFAEYDSITFADSYYGTVGVGEWGLADVNATRVALAQAEGCGYAKHAAGSIRLEGDNAAQLYFQADPEVEPTEEDTGGGDTGATAGPDTPPDGAEASVDADDTGDTADVVIDGLNYTPLTFGGNGDFCGSCPAGLIADQVLPECVAVGRPLLYPFFAPW